MKARCPNPNHFDNNPSFSMNLETGLWICFSCNQQGEFTKLIELVLGCSQGEAYEWITNNGQASSVEQLSRNLDNLLGTPIGSVQEPISLHWRAHYEVLNNQIMPQWFLNRGFTWETINHWKIKYDPLMDSVIVPVFQEYQLIGTVTKNIKEGLPKYQNSPNLPRSEILFGEINPNAKRIYLVEGLLDCIYSWQCGFTALSLLGSSISNKQIEILHKHRFGNITLALDNDDVGKKATKEIIKRLQQTGYLLPQLNLVRWPIGTKDPNDCSPELLREIFEDSVTVSFL